MAKRRAAGTALQLPGQGRSPEVLAEGLVCLAGAGMEGSCFAFSPQAPQGCDPADSYSPSAELLLALRLVLLAFGKPLRFSSLLLLFLSSRVFRVRDIIYPFHFSLLFQARTIF